LPHIRERGRANDANRLGFGTNSPPF
jgi:hypothetical protein